MTELKDDLSDLNYAEIARKQKVGRAAIQVRVQRGWTRDEIMKGQRDKKNLKKKTARRYAEQLGGYTVEQVAKANGLSVPGLYYRLANKRDITLPGETSPK